jgi:hypothetical protein
MKTLEIKGTGVFGIKRLTKHDYNSESEGYKDKSYFRYRANGRVFVVHEEDDFNNAFANGDIAELHLLETPSKEDASVMQLTLGHFVTHAQLIKHTSFEAKLEAIKAGRTAIAIEDLATAEDLS